MTAGDACFNELVSKMTFVDNGTDSRVFEASWKQCVESSITDRNGSIHDRSILPSRTIHVSLAKGARAASRTNDVSTPSRHLRVDVATLP